MPTLPRRCRGARSELSPLQAIGAKTAFFQDPAVWISKWTEMDTPCSRLRAVFDRDNKKPSSLLMPRDAPADACTLVSRGAQAPLQLCCCLLCRVDGHRIEAVFTTNPRSKATAGKTCRIPDATPVGQQKGRQHGSPVHVGFGKIVRSADGTGHSGAPWREVIVKANRRPTIGLHSTDAGLKN